MGACVSVTSGDGQYPLPEQQARVSSSKLPDDPEFDRGDDGRDPHFGSGQPKVPVRMRRRSVDPFVFKSGEHDGPSPERGEKPSPNRNGLGQGGSTPTASSGAAAKLEQRRGSTSSMLEGSHGAVAHRQGKSGAAQSSPQRPGVGLSVIPPPSPQTPESAGSPRSEDSHGGTPGGRAASASPTTPERFIRWQCGDLIGSGGFGRVFKGMDLDTGSLIAVKQIALALGNGAGKGGGVGGSCDVTTTVESGYGLGVGVGGGDKGGGGSEGGGGGDEGLRQIEMEVALMKRLKHPNIVSYLGTERTEDGVLNIFMEFVPGGSIYSLLRTFGSFSEKVIRVYSRQILLGLEYLHRHQIMHRDIKGANILVDNAGVVKLADFGASKRLAEMVTMEGGNRSIKGTPYWMAPEVIKQTGHGRQADIWSVGCTILEMATGKPPWSEFGSQMSALFHIASSKGPPPIPESLSHEAHDFLLLCFNRVPKDRPNATRLLQHPFVVTALVSPPPPIRPPSAASSLHGEGYPEAPETSPSMPTTVSMTGDELTRALAGGVRPPPHPAASVGGSRGSFSGMGGPGVGCGGGGAGFNPKSEVYAKSEVYEVASQDLEGFHFRPGTGGSGSGVGRPGTGASAGGGGGLGLRGSSRPGTAAAEEVTDEDVVYHPAPLMSTGTGGPKQPPQIMAVTGPGPAPVRKKQLAPLEGGAPRVPGTTAPAGDFVRANRFDTGVGPARDGAISGKFPSSPGAGSAGAGTDTSQSAMVIPGGDAGSGVGAGAGAAGKGTAQAATGKLQQCSLERVVPRSVVTAAAAVTTAANPSPSRSRLMAPTVSSSARGTPSRPNSGMPRVGECDTPTKADRARENATPARVRLTLSDSYESLEEDLLGFRQNQLAPVSLAASGRLGAPPLPGSGEGKQESDGGRAVGVVDANVDADVVGGDVVEPGEAGGGAADDAAKRKLWEEELKHELEVQRAEMRRGGGVR